MKKIFEYIANNKDFFLKSSNGVDFEDRFEEIIRKNGYTKLNCEDYQVFLRTIKKSILNKRGSSFVKNEYDEDVILSNSFLRIPYGSQNYPDFLIITKKYLIPIEIKYSRGKSISPMWNSNLPKVNGIYLFGSYGRKDITFFAGSLVIRPEERNDMLDFFTSLKKLEKEFKVDRMKKKYKENYSRGRGFIPYVRVAFQHNKELGESNFFEAHDRKAIEKETLNILSNLE